MLLKFEIENIEILYSNFTKSDYFQWNSDEKFDYIIGNPPWGASFTDKKKLELKEKYVKKSEKTVVSKGDINNDGKTDVADLVTLQQFILGKSELKNSEAADVCEDKVIDIYDIVALRKLLISTPK